MINGEVGYPHHSWVQLNHSDSVQTQRNVAFFHNLFYFNPFFSDSYLFLFALWMFLRVHVLQFYSTGIVYCICSLYFWELRRLSIITKCGADVKADRISMSLLPLWLIVGKVIALCELAFIHNLLYLTRRHLSPRFIASLSSSISYSGLLHSSCSTPSFQFHWQ